MKKINMYGLNKSVVEELKQYKITLITKRYEKNKQREKLEKEPS